MAVSQFLLGSFGRRDGAVFYPERLSGFNLSSSTSEEDVLTYPTSGVNIKQRYKKVQTDKTWELTATSNVLRDADVPVIFQQQAATISSIVLPVFGISRTVPATSAYTVTVTGLTEDQVLSVTVESTTTDDLPLTQIDAADVSTIASGEFAVTANTVTFHSAQAEANVLIAYDKTQTSISVIGATSALDPVADQEFLGKFKTESTGVWSIWIPNCQRSGETTFDSEIDAIENVWSVNLPSGWNLPFAVWKDPA
jgi:hypothetical protein